MTDRITHDEALRALNVPWDTTRLRAYIDQQRAAEAATVSRAEHEAVLDRVLGQRESEHDSRITALQAEHYDVVNRWSLKLSAAEARVAELEEALTEAAGHLEAFGAHVAALVARKHASPPPAAAGRAVSGAELLDAVAGRPVAEASVQPAPAGVERCQRCSHQLSEHRDGFCSSCECGGYLTLADTTPTGGDLPTHAYWREDEDASLDLHIRQREASRPDYVTYDVLVEALRDLDRSDGVWRPGFLADRLEKARKP